MEGPWRFSKILVNGPELTMQHSTALPRPIYKDFMQYIFGALEVYWSTLGRFCFWYWNFIKTALAYCGVFKVSLSCDKNSGKAKQYSDAYNSSIQWRGREQQYNSTCIREGHGGHLLPLEFSISRDFTWFAPLIVEILTFWFLQYFAPPLDLNPYIGAVMKYF